MGEPVDELTPKQAQAIAALLGEPSITAAAAVVGVDEKTIRRWLAEKPFATVYRQQRTQIVEHVLSRIQTAAGQATTRLVKLLRCGNLQVEARAAKTILDLAVRGVEITDVLERLEALEASLGAK